MSSTATLEKKLQDDIDSTIRVGGEIADEQYREGFDDGRQLGLGLSDEAMIVISAAELWFDSEGRHAGTLANAIKKFRDKEDELS